MGASAIPIILSVLKNGESYGYEIVQRVKEITNGGITWKEASIYPVLKKLEKDSMVQSYWKMEPGERPRRYYTILPEGKKQLKLNLDEFELITKALKILMKPAT